MSKQKELNDRLTEAASLGDWAALEQALADGADAMAEDSMALWLAATKGRVEFVSRLIALSDPTARDSQALMWTADVGMRSA